MNTKKSWMKMMGAFLFLVIIGLAPASMAKPFTHPGALHTQTDLDRMRAKVAAAAEPWTSSWNRLITSPHAQLSWRPRPTAVICRGGGCARMGLPQNYIQLARDIAAAYQCALRHHISGDVAYANKAVEIMNAWPPVLTRVTGDSNVSLAAGAYGYEFACVGEMMRNYKGWVAADQTAFKNMMLNIFYPLNHDFLIRHHNNCDSHYRCNWDAVNIAAVIAVGVLCDDRAKFDEAVNYFTSGRGNGNINRAVYYIHPDGLGQWEESGRDQPHTMGGLSWLSIVCEIAWNQGVDLYGYDNNRLLRGLEYTAKYNLGKDVPYVSYRTCDQTYFEAGVSSAGRGHISPMWELVYNHYVNRMGLSAPYTAHYAARVRPEGGGGHYGPNSGGYDLLGFGTLTFTLDPIASSAIPSGVTAKASGQQVTLTWWGAAYATGYKVKRATTTGGPYKTIATVTGSTYVDTTVVEGATYYYVISARSPSGESDNSAEAVAIAGTWLWAYLAFDEECGTTASDSSGNGWDGTLVNGPTWEAGYIGNAVSLNGAGQYVSLPSGVIRDLDDFTIATWVNLNTVSTWARIFDFGMGTERYMYLTPQAGRGGPVRFVITTTGSRAEQQISGTAALPAGEWHHVAVTLTGGVGILYVDGVEVGRNRAMFFTPAMLGDMGNTTQNWIGRSQFSSDPYLNGLVDEFRIYSGALSAAEIAALAAAQLSQ